MTPELASTVTCQLRSALGYGATTSIPDNDPARLEALERGEWTYALYCPALAVVKIGRSVKPDQRLHDIMRFMPCETEIIRLWPAEELPERVAHRKWRHLRLRGEWFRATPDLMAFIRGDGA